ncbi:MAG: UDP-2,3-diacylglucosamine diphosphatase [Gemmatimonadota bacterium]|jgi:UDP-2,3-diacylglucosamine hydrolase
MQKPEIVVSDIHLGAVPATTERAFLRFLDWVGERAGSLLIAGDLFDFWFEYGRVIHGSHFRVLAALSSLVEAGIPVSMVGGNHDAWGGRFLRDDVGLTFHRGAFRTTLGGRPALVAHGDGLGAGDFRYRLLKTLVRSRVTIALFRALHPELGFRIARAVSRTDLRLESDRANEGRARFIEAWARDRLEREPDLGWVVCGHAHVPTLVDVGNRRYYLNAGDWIRHLTFAEIADGEPALLAWDPLRSAPRPTGAGPSP